MGQGGQGIQGSQCGQCGQCGQGFQGGQGMQGVNNKVFDSCKLFSKIPKKHKQASDIHDTRHWTFYIVKEDTLAIDTIINGIKETSNVARHGDVVITGGFGEKYVVRIEKLFGLYNVIDGIMIPRPIEKQVVRVTRKIINMLGGNPGVPFTFVAPWGEAMIASIGDVLVKDGDGFYRIEKNAFQKTYMKI
jgi:hypothetical protein